MRPMRIVAAMVFGLLGLFMLVVAVIIGAGAFGSLMREAMPQERLVLGMLTFLSAAVSAVFILLALRVSGALARRPTLAERVLAVLVGLFGLLIIVVNLASPPAQPTGVALGVVVLLGALVYGALLVSLRRRARQSDDSDASRT